MADDGGWQEAVVRAGDLRVVVVLCSIDREEERERAERWERTRMYRVRAGIYACVRDQCSTQFS